MLQLVVLATQLGDLGGVGLAYGVAHQAAFAGLEKLLGPVVVEVWADALATAELGDGLLAIEPLEYDADLLFTGELAAGLALDLADDLLGISILAHGTLLWSGHPTPECPLDLSFIVSGRCWQKAESQP